MLKFKLERLYKKGAGLSNFQLSTDIKQKAAFEKNIRYYVQIFF